MKRRALFVLCAPVLASAMVAASDETARPAKISKPELGGKIFERPDVVEQTHADGHVTQTATSKGEKSHAHSWTCSVDRVGRGLRDTFSTGIRAIVR